MANTNSYVKLINSIRPLDEEKLLGVSFFSGGGGLDLGLSYAGFNFKYATDVEQYYCDTISHNNPSCIVEAKDINELSGHYIKDLLKSRPVSIIAGGAPCQSFSILGKRGSFEDERGKLVFKFVDLISQLQPESFVFENVPGLLTLNKGRDFEELLLYFRDNTNYKIHWKILNSADYGIPQARKRLFLVGFQKEVEFSFPESTHQNYQNVSLFQQDLLATVKHSWLPAKLALEAVDGLPNHDIRIHGERVRKRYQIISPGGRDKIDHTDRIDPDRPSGTVLVGSKAGGGRPFIHPYLPRHITVREAARLQSFPDWYKFLGTSTAQYRQVGNAVPPLLAFALGKSIKCALQSYREQRVVA